MIDAFANSLVRHRGRWSLLFLLLLGGALALGSRLSLRYEASDFLPRGGAVPAGRPVPGLGGADRIVVVVESDQSMTPGEIGPVVDTLAQRLATIPGVRRVEHRLPPEVQRFIDTEAARYLLLYFEPLELESLGVHLSRPYMERALLGIGARIPHTELALAMGIERSDPLGVVGPAIKKLRELGGETRVKLAEGYFAVPDQRAFFLTVEPARTLARIDSARVMVARINRVLSGIRGHPAFASALRGKRLFAIGRPVALVAAFGIALSDVQRVGIASTLVVFLLLVLCLRRVVAPLFIVGTVLCAIALTAGAAYLVFGAVSLLGWVFIASLIGFGDEFALYVVAQYWIGAPAGASRAEALAAAIRRPGPGILLGGLTSAAAFFSLVVLSYPIMVQLGWLTTMGLLIVLASSLTLLPLGLAYTEPGRGGAAGWYRWTGVPHRVGQRRRLLWLSGWLALVIVSVVLARTLTFELHPWRLAVRGIPATGDFERITERLGQSFTPFLMVSRGLTEEAALAADRTAVRELESIQDDAGVAAIVSASRWIPAPEQQRASLDYLRAHRAVFSAERFRREFNSVASRMQHPDSLLTARYLPLVARYLESPPPGQLSPDTLRRLGLGELLQQHLAQQGSEFVAVSQVYLSRIPWSEGAVDQFTGTIAREGGPALRRARFVSDALSGATHAAVLRRDLRAVTALVVSLTLLVLVVRFRRVIPVALCLLPLLCGVCAALGLMALLGIRLNLLTLAVTPLIIGLGSDDGIHIVDRLERGEPVDQVLAEAGTPMIITTLTTIAAFACLGFARFPGVREMGLVAAWGLLVCLAASLQLVPLCYGMRRRPEPKLTPVS